MAAGDLSQTFPRCRRWVASVTNARVLLHRAWQIDLATHHLNAAIMFKYFHKFSVNGIHHFHFTACHFVAE